MKNVSILRFAFVLALACSLGTAIAQDAPKAPARGEPAHTTQHESGKGVLRLLPPDAVTEHSIDTPHGKLAYTATAGTLPFYDQSGEQSAAVFYTAYVAK
ncbi:MAG TPA: carboxypeptidase, partial [Pseudolabrys sp.]|nr:carboxypeptidase [Pseudolabrys sp.]